MLVHYEENSPAAIAYKLINHTQRNVFLTGKAGTGKTTFLHNVLRNTHKKAVICAPTGIAAINAGGTTLHSMFQLGFGAYVPDANYQADIYSGAVFQTPKTLMNDFKMTENKRKVIREMELLVIDEVSMLRADLLDAVDRVCKIVRKKATPFGGVQVLFIGDLLQLPPVVKENEWNVLNKYYKSVYFFDAWALAGQAPIYIELDKIYRQKDETFINVLNHLRNGIMTPEDIAILNQHYHPEIKTSRDNHFITLTTHNRTADQINLNLLEELTTPAFTFEAEVTGDFMEYAYPVEKTLMLKQGAQIMFVKNDPNRRYFNGKIGTVKSINDDEIEVQLADSVEIVKLERAEWENNRYVINEETKAIETQVMGKFCQFPVKLAWAITVHKSQGLTFEKAIVDIGNAFAPGQVYVALSRLKSLDGLIMHSYINQASLMQDETVTKYGDTQHQQEDVSEIIEKEKPLYLLSCLQNSFDCKELSEALFIHETSYQNLSIDKSTKRKFHTWAIDIKQKIDDLQVVASKFMNEMSRIITAQEAEYLTHLLTRVEAAENYFLGVLKKEISGMQALYQKVKAEKKVKGYMAELQEIEAALKHKKAEIEKAKAYCLAVANNTMFVNPTQSTPDTPNTFKEPFKSAVTKAEKTPKIPTTTITFEMYKQGKTLSEIAAERNLVEGTISGHLCHYVVNGELKSTDFISEEKLAHILSVITEENINSRSTIKAALPEEFTYVEINFALAHKAFLEKQGENKEG